MTAAPDRVPFGIKMNYGVGAIAYGIKENGFSTFLLLFYNQVIGLPAGLVGAVIAVALIFDAMIDPLLGVLSDRTRSRWGRRHPWLYASALPIALTWLLLWNPPQGSQSMVLGWLLVTAVLTRAAIATNEVPSLALAPELTRDYHERTNVIRYRFLFGWVGGLLLLFLAYGVFLAPTAAQPAGLLRREGYDAYAWTGVIMMMISILIVGLGTHKRLAHPPLKMPPKLPLREELKAIASTLNNRAFLVLMGAGVFAYANQGLNFATSTYMQTYVWEFPRWAFTAYPFTLLAGVILAFIAAPIVSRRLGKRNGAAWMAAIAVVVGLAPYVLRLTGYFPSNGEAATLPIFFLCITLATGLAVAPMILVGSMLADVIEDSEMQTGQRQEGLFFAGNLFMQKCVTGIGTFAAGSLITLVGFPDNAVPGQVDAAVIDRLMLVFTILTALFIGGAVWAFTRYPLSEADHTERVAVLAARAAE